MFQMMDLQLPDLLEERTSYEFGIKGSYYSTDYFMAYRNPFDKRDTSFYDSIPLWRTNIIGVENALWEACSKIKVKDIEVLLRITYFEMRFSFIQKEDL